MTMACPASGLSAELIDQALAALHGYPFDELLRPKG
jgi:hypothetical protein